MAEIDTNTQTLQHLKCSLCNKVYSSEKLLFKHLDKHKHPKHFTCLECNKTFPTKSRLKIHDQIHSGDRPFKCSYCQIYFASRFQLKLHQRRHTGEKPYSCSFCEKEFSSSSGLRQHVKTHTKESPFSCDQCSKSFKQKEKLKQHERIHTGLRPFMCDQCPKTFRIKNALVRHLRIHSGDTYKCKWCPKGFGELYALKKHHRKQHDKTQFTGPSEKVNSGDKANCHNFPHIDYSSLGKKVKRSQKNKNKVKDCTQKDCTQKNKKQQIKVSSPTPVTCLAASKSDLSKDVAKKLYLEIGHRDTPVVVDENGWHRIPLSTASDFLSRNTGTLKKPGFENSKDSLSHGKIGAHNDRLCGQKDPEYASNEAVQSPVESQPVTEQLGGITNSCSGKVLPTALLQMIPKESSPQNYENTASPSVCQQPDPPSMAGRKIRRITHTSTIDYFPVADQASEPVYSQEVERLKFLKNSACATSQTSYMQNLPRKSLVYDPQGSDFNRESFTGTGSLSKIFLSDYYIHRFQHADGDQLPEQGDSTFYQLQRPSDRIISETDHCPKATLHHRPDPYPHNYPHNEDEYFSVEPQYSNSSPPEAVHQIDLNCSWNDSHTDVHEAAQFNRSSPGTLHHQHASSSCTLPSSMPPFRSSLQPKHLAAASCGQDSFPFHQNSAFSLMPFHHIPFEVKSSHVPHLNEHCEPSNQDLHQNKSSQSNQPYQSQPCLHQNEPLQSNQPFQDESAQLHQLSLQLSIKQTPPLLDQSESAKSSQHAQLFCNYNFSTRTDMPSYHNVISAQDTQQAVVMFSRSESSVVHHKPIPVPQNENKIDVRSLDVWPVYFETQRQHLLDPRQSLTQSFPCSVVSSVVKLPSCIANEGFTENNNYQNNKQMNNVKNLNLPISASFKSVPDCSVADKSRSHCCENHITFGLPTGGSDCIVPENVRDRHQIYHQSDLPKGESDCIVLKYPNDQQYICHHMNLNLPTSAPLESAPITSAPITSAHLENTPLKTESKTLESEPLESEPLESVSGCVAVENSNNKQHSGCNTKSVLPTRQRLKSYKRTPILTHSNSDVQKNSSCQYHKNLPNEYSCTRGSKCFVPQNSYITAQQIQGFMSPLSNSPTSDSSLRKDTIPQHFPVSNIYPNTCLDTPSKTEADLGRAAKDDDSPSKMNKSCGEFSQTGGQFSNVTALEEANKLPERGKKHNSRKMSPNFEYTTRKKKNECITHKKKNECTTRNLNSKPKSFISIHTEISERLGQFSDDNDFKVSNDEDDFEVNCIKTNQVQPIVKKQKKENGEIALTKPDVGQDEGNNTILSGKSKFGVTKRTSPLRSKCFSKYRKLSPKVNIRCHGITQNRDRASESINFSETIQINKPCVKSLESNILGSEQEYGNEASKQQSICSNKLNNLCSETSICDNKSNVKENSNRPNLIRKNGRRNYNNVPGKISDSKVLDKLDFLCSDSHSKLINNPQSNLCPTVDEKGKVDLIERKSCINQENKLEEIKSLRTENDHEIILDNQVVKTDFDELPWKCQTCWKKFPNNSRLQRHIKTHVSQKPYPCSICPHAFTAKKYLDNHISRHNKQPPIFACDDCGKTFPRRYQLKIHYRTHTGEKPYKCSHCSSYFATSFQVQLHERVHFDNLPFRCHFCGKCFRSNTNLSLHVKRHTNNKPYLCATCGATFYEASKLKSHIRIHTGLHPFMCDQCPKTFKVKHLLVRHLRWHSNDTFKCEHCNKPFDERWTLKAHIQKHHLTCRSEL